ncbi:MAG: hypothetical protein IH991_01970, partial [Planctomycetes bacterium]|nr:hypothetical protein [Planctomycetota bacterium]
IGNMPAPADDADVAEVIRRCLSPDASQRPTAKDVVMVLNGRLKLESLERSSDTEPPPIPKPGAEPELPPELPIDPKPTGSPEPAPAAAQELSLVGESGQKVSMRVRTLIGKHLLRALGSDAEFYHSSEQFVLERQADGKWYSKHNSEAKHQTLLNGKSIVEPTPVNDGDILAVGSEERAIQKLPVTVRIH